KIVCGPIECEKRFIFSVETLDSLEKHLKPIPIFILEIFCNIAAAASTFPRNMHIIVIFFETKNNLSIDKLRFMCWFGLELEISVQTSKRIIEVTLNPLLLGKFKE
ncbi:hypothetical protein ACJX0J_007882, partial [Zea mays]